MYSPRQPRIQSGVNGGRFASYGDPHTSKSATRRGKAKRKTSGQRRLRRDKQLTISQKAHTRARHALKASRGKGRLRGKYR
jgi:hypothetical protein